MSRTEWRRPIRVLPAQQCVLIPAGTAPCRQPPEDDRFRRVLGGPLPPAPSEPPVPPAPARAEPHDRADKDAPSPPAPAPRTKDPAPPSPTLAPASSATASTSAHVAADPHAVDASRLAARPRALDAAAKEEWPHAMAGFIYTLCKRADPSFRTWSATLPMNPQSLPETELQLNFSPHWLRLRFSTQSSRSAALISLHRARLVSLLEEAPALPPGIDVDIG